ncbi:MAG: LPS assembly lipoprotein LptE [Stellaceae bacterium]
MSWRELAAAALALPLVACGFHPLYAERSPLGYNPVFASIEVRPAADRLGQIMTDAVRQTLNPRGVDIEKRYVLRLSATEVRSDLGIRRDNTSARGELLINANLSLAPRGTATPLYSDSVRSTTAYNISNDAYAATVAEENARDEAAAQLGREIALRVQLFLRRQAEAKP